VVSFDWQVASNDAVSVNFWIIPEALGQIPIDISATSPVAGDTVKVMLLVKVSVISFVVLYCIYPFL